MPMLTPCYHVHPWFSERLMREREIMEQRAEQRLEIFKNLVGKMAPAGASTHKQVTVTQSSFLPKELFCSIYYRAATTNRHNRRLSKLINICI